MLDSSQVRAEAVPGGLAAVRRAPGPAAAAGRGGGRLAAGGAAAGPRHQGGGQRDVRGRGWTHRAAPLLRHGQRGHHAAAHLGESSD